MTNYQLELDKILAGLDGRRPGLLLHACCAPCSSYTLEYLAPYFDITLFWFNPNIQPYEEHEKRLAELRKLLSAMNFDGVKLITGEYCDGAWGDCSACQGLRIERTAEAALCGGFEYFCSTLSISPHKNAALINGLGLSAAEKLGNVKWLPSDFKKRGGFLRSAELCREYGIYRQNYCGCYANRR
jgi:predicted adenine nucleotide alpha hydrolase (AANH) superfamily ATPase